jgi:uncharacterized protein
MGYVLSSAWSLNRCASHSFRHKDYLYQKLLAHRLPMDSFRFDFRCEVYCMQYGIIYNICLSGNHETGGDFKHAKIGEDVVDLQVVVAYLKNKFGYKIDMLVGHSRGAGIAFHWICKSEEGKHVSAMVNVSGRYRMPVSEI